MKKIKDKELLVLSKFSFDKIKEMNFLLLPWRTENVGCTKEDYDTLHKVCYDLLLLDFSQVMYNTGNKIFLDEIIMEKDFGKKLLPDTIKYTALNLRLLHFARILLVSNISKQNTLYKNMHIRIYGNLDTDKAMHLYHTYKAFLKKWVFSPIFLHLYALKYKQKLFIPEKFLREWENFKIELFYLFKLFKKHLADLTSIKSLYFWLTRLYEANNWRPEQKHFKELCKKVSFYDDMENNRVYTYADYFDSILGAQMLREYGNLLNFPVFRQNKFKTYNRNSALDSINRQVYDRMTASLIAIQKSDKNELLVKSTSLPDTITNKEFLSIFNFIRYYSFIHFMGNISELFAFIRMAFEIDDYFDSDLVVIPGSSIELLGDKGIKQGPDGIIGSIKMKNKTVHLDIHGIIEIKSYRVSQSKLIRQLKKHHRRLMNEKIRISISDFSKTSIFINKDATDKETSFETVEIKDCQFIEDLKYYALVPAYKRKTQSTKKKDLQLVELPWYPDGFKKMGFYFSQWIVQNFGRIGAEDDYNRGIASWIYLMKRVIKEEKLSNRQANSIKKILTAFENGVASPDLDWKDI